MRRPPKVRSKQAGAALERRESEELPNQIREKIHQRAYELYELRGREDGCDFDDWLKAESEVAGKADRQ